jgi:hypothetical protein
MPHPVAGLSYDLTAAAAGVQIEILRIESSAFG